MILVTGGCGYIGSHVVKALTEAGEQVVVFDSLIHGQSESLLRGEELVIGDIRDKDALQKVFATHKFSEVIHLAALVNAAESVEKAELYAQVNDQGSLNVWETAKSAGVTTFIYASSAAVYGVPQDFNPIKEDAPLLPSNPYGVTKLAGEKSLAEIVGQAGRYLSFRFFNVGGAEEQGRLGPNKDSQAIMQRLFAVASGKDESITIHGHDYDTQDGTVVRDFVHVEDIALAFVLGLSYLRKGRESAIINLGSGEAHTIGEVIKEVEIITGKTIPFVYGPRSTGDISYSLADIGLAEKILGWEPVHTLRLIVRDGWNSYVQHKV